jgi:adenine-specific DNA methylase
MFAIEYWCQQCYEKTYRHTRSKRRAQAEARGYKGAEEFDRNLYLQACEEFERRKVELPLPEGEIPAEGRSDPRPISFGMRRWQDLFNPRQLLCLGMLMKAILQIEDKAVRELMAVTLSDCVNCNNMLCEYNARRTEIEPLFGHHAYWPKNMPIENNVWGTELGRGSWESYAEKTLKCVRWLLKPTEPIETDEDSDEERKKVDLADSPLTLTNQDANSVLNGDFRCALYARTAEDLSFLPDKSIDAIITDPPYYGNVMYGE